MHYQCDITVGWSLVQLLCSLSRSVLRLGRSSTLKYEVATPTEDEDIFGTNLVMKSLKNLQKFNQDFPQSTITRVMTMPPQRGEHKGASSMSGLLKSSKRQSKTDVHSKSSTEDPPPHTGKEGMNDTVTSNEVPPTDVLEEVCGRGRGLGRPSAFDSNV